MSFTLSNLLQQVYAELGQLQVGTATGGTTSTLVDSRMANLGLDDDWENGAICIMEADSQAPEGEYQRISSYADGSGTFTLEEGLTAAPQSGDTYGLVSAYYPLYTMVELVNAGLRALGDIPLVDTTTLDTAARQTEYAAGDDRLPGADRG